jgi:hypothetical protein
MYRATGIPLVRRTSLVSGSNGGLRRATRSSVIDCSGAEAGGRLFCHVLCHVVALSADMMCCSSRSQPCWRVGTSLAMTRSPGGLGGSRSPQFVLEG